jgi:hypothetical protein
MKRFAALLLLVLAVPAYAQDGYRPPLFKPVPPVPIPAPVVPPAPPKPEPAPVEPTPQCPPVVVYVYVPYYVQAPPCVQYQRRGLFRRLFGGCR